MKRYYCRIFIILIQSCLLVAPNLVFSSTSFQTAKKIASQLFTEHRETLYCACKYNERKEIDLASCNMQSANNIKRAHKMEWEHMMPAENFGRHLACWQEKTCVFKGKATKGRKCCEKTDELFNRMEGELYNLWPAVGLINQARTNYRYSVLEGHGNFYGCDFKVDPQLRKAEPANRAKGIVARANLFMAEKYSIKLSPAQQHLFEAWNKQFPPSPWEKQWATKVAQIEGYQNHFIDDN